MAEHDVNPDDEELSPEEVAKKIRASGLDGQYATVARCMVNVQRMGFTQHSYRQGPSEWAERRILEP